MRNGTLCLFAVILLLPIQSAVAEMSWYIGAGGGLTRLTTSDFVAFSGLSPPPGAGDTAFSAEFLDSPFGWQIYGGAMFTENIGLVVKYSDSGKGKDTWLASTVIAAAPTNYNFTGEMQMDGYTIYLVQSIPLGDKFSYGIEAGWTDQDIEFTWGSTSTPPTPNSGKFKRDSSGFAFGAVLRYEFVKHIAVSTEFEWLLVDFGDLIDRPVKLNINLEYHF